MDGKKVSSKYYCGTIWSCFVDRRLTGFGSNFISNMGLKFLITK